jgi:hypothetical protein
MKARGKAFQSVVYSGLSISLRIANPTLIPWPAKKNAALTGAVNPIDGIHQGFAVRTGSTFIKQIKLCLAAGKIGQHDTSLCVPVAITPDARKRTLGSGNDVPAVLSGYQ